MKNIYLDVDAVIILDDLKNAGNGALGLALFLSYLNYNQSKDKYCVCWLTTHCKDGSDKRVLEYLKSKKLWSFDYSRIVEMKIKPTSWRELKTEAIDFSEDFLWIDDELFPEELEVLKKHNAENKFVKIDLQKNKYQLKDIAYSGTLGDDPWESGDPRYLTEVTE